MMMYDDKEVHNVKLVEVLSSSSKERTLLEGSLDDQKEEEVCIYLDKVISSYSCR